MKVSIIDWWILVVERNSLFSKSGLIKVGQKQIDKLSAVIKLVLYCWLTLKWEWHAQNELKMVCNQPEDFKHMPTFWSDNNKQPLNSSTSHRISCVRKSIKMSRQMTELASYCSIVRHRITFMVLKKRNRLDHMLKTNKRKISSVD